MSGGQTSLGSQVCVCPGTGGRGCVQSHFVLPGLGQGLAWCEWRCYWQCPALEKCRNLISTFSETGFSGCANTNVLPAVLSGPSTLQQNPPQNPTAEANDQNHSYSLLPTFPFVPQISPGARKQVGGKVQLGGVSEPLLRMDVSWRDSKVSNPGCGTQRGILACPLNKANISRQNLTRI